MTGVIDKGSAVLRAQLEVMTREREEWADRAMRAMARCDELEADLTMWRLRFRLRHWLIQLPPEPAHIPQRTDAEVDEVIARAVAAATVEIPAQRRAPRPKPRPEVDTPPTPGRGIPMGVRVPGRKPGL